jgi:cell division protein FtsQ
MVKKRKPTDNRRKKIVIYATVICLSWIIVGIGSAARSNVRCTDVVTHFSNNTDNMFLNKDTIELVLKRANGNAIRSTRIGDLNTSQMEVALERNPYIKVAEVYKDLATRLVVDVELRKPIARVICVDGSSFYLDKEFHKMKVVSSWVPNVPLIHGMLMEPLQPADKILSKELANLKEMLLFIEGNEFLHAQISELIVTAGGEITLMPEVGNTKIEFGKPDQIAEKFEKLMLFYHQVSAKAGWDHYRSVNLKYKNQVIAKKKS